MTKRWAGIARFGGIGDNLIAASPLKALKRLGYMTEVITNEPNHVVFQNNPYLDRLTLKKPDKDLPQGDMNAWQQWFLSRSNEYDVFIHASHSCEGRHAFFRSMTDFWAPAPYRRSRAAGSYLETVHDIAEIPHDFGPLFWPTAEEWSHNYLTLAKLGLERYMVWVLCGTRIDKVYPYSTQAIPRIIKEVGCPVILMGGPLEKEHKMAAEIKAEVERTNSTRQMLHLAVPTVSGEKAWPLRTSLTMALGADLVVAPDTGTAWAVAFEAMPKIILHSHASKENITKHWVNTTSLHADQDRVPCWPCHRLHDGPETCVENKEKNGAACISDIPVETLVAAVAAKWTRSAEVVPFQGSERVARISSTSGAAA